MNNFFAHQKTGLFEKRWFLGLSKLGGGTNFTQVTK
jgi:hypothetical protein